MVLDQGPTEDQVTYVDIQTSRECSVSSAGKKDYANIRVV
jgi:hypothetical protein